MGHVAVQRAIWAGAGAAALALILLFWLCAPVTPHFVDSRRIWQPGDDSNLVNSSQYIVFDEFLQELSTYGLWTNPVRCDLNGEVLWSFTDAFGVGSVYDSQWSDDQRLYILTGDHHLYVLTSDRKLLWSTAVPWDQAGRKFCTMALDSAGRCIVFSGEHAYCIDRDGVIEWANSFSRLDAYVTPAIDETGRIYGRGLEGQLLAISPAGDELWRTSPGAARYPGNIKTLPGCGPVCIDDGGVLNALDGSGKLLWSYTPRLPFSTQVGIMQNSPDQLLLLTNDAKDEAGKPYRSRYIALGPQGRVRWARACPHMSGELIVLPGGRLFYTDDFVKRDKNARPIPRGELRLLFDAWLHRKPLAAAVLSPGGRVELRLPLDIRGRPVLAADGATNRLYVLSFDGVLSSYDIH